MIYWLGLVVLFSILTAYARKVEHIIGNEPKWKPVLFCCLIIIVRSQIVSSLSLAAPLWWPGQRLTVLDRASPSRLSTPLEQLITFISRSQSPQTTNGTKIDNMCYSRLRWPQSFHFVAIETAIATAGMSNQYSNYCFNLFNWLSYPFEKFW